MKVRADSATGVRFRPATSKAVRLRNTLVLSAASARVGPFATANYLQSPAGSGPDLNAGNTLVILFWHASNPAAVAVPWSNSRAAGGWYLNILTAGTIRMSIRTSGGAASNFSSSGSLYVGLNCLAITRTAGGAVRSSLNGVTAIQVSAAPSYSANDGTSQHYIGKCNTAAFTGPATTTHALEVAHIAAEFSDAELVAASTSVGADDRYQLIDAVRTHGSLVFNWSAYRDWDGSAGTTTPGLGSNKPVFTVNGTCTRTAIESEIIYPEKRSWWQDNYDYTVTGDYVARNGLARVQVTTSATHLTVDIGQHNGADDVELCTRVIGSSATSVIGYESAMNRTMDVEFSAGAKTIDLMDQVRGIRTGRVGAIRRIRAPLSTPLTFVAPVRPARRLIVCADDLSEGYSLSGRSSLCWIQLLRDDFPGGVLNEAYNTDGWYRFADTNAHRNAAVAKWAAECDGATTNQIYFALGTNDYGVPGASAATTETNVGLILDQFHAIRPDVTIFLQTPIQRVNETNTNSYGDNLAAYRTALTNVQTARSSWITLVDGSSMITYTTNYQADNIKPNAAGHVQWKAAVKTALGY